jgi:hypothetical protein
MIGDRNILVLSDEIYSRLLFEGEHFSIMSVPGMQERTILLDGFSKTYAMTGWRMGYGVMRPDLAAHMTRLMTNSNSCTASFTQIAGVEALTGDQSSVDHMCSEFKRRRDVFVAGLNKIKGFSCRMPKGAFYVFPNITKTGWKSKPLADALLEQAGVAALSGTAFGAFGEGYLRFSVANSLENLQKALERIDQWCQRRRFHREQEHPKAVVRTRPATACPLATKACSLGVGPSSALGNRTTTGSPRSSRTVRRIPWWSGGCGRAAVSCSARAAGRVRHATLRRIPTASCAPNTRRKQSLWKA